MSDLQKPDYALFDSKAYHDQIFSSASGPKGQENMRLFVLDSLADIFRPGKIHGETLLDFGTGPVFYNVINAISHFPNIYFSDFSEGNRNALWRWLSKATDALDHSHFFKYFCERQSTFKNWSEMEDTLRSRVKGILHCDMTQNQPLFPSIFPQFDCITSGLCLEVAPGWTAAAYKTAAKNMVSLLKPGGWIVLNGVIDCSSYAFGKQSYPVVKQSSDELKEAWTELGFAIDVWKQYEMTSDEKAINKNSNSNGMFCMSAQKIK